MRYEIRLAISADRESAAPYARPMSRRTSQSSGNGYWNFFANAALSSTVSKDAPRISVFFFWNSG
jgi:hypothetical protein